MEFYKEICQFSVTYFYVLTVLTITKMAKCETLKIYLTNLTYSLVETMNRNGF